jgi:hypothetical protein
MAEIVAAAAPVCAALRFRMIQTSAKFEGMEEDAKGCVGPAAAAFLR